MGLVGEEYGDILLLCVALAALVLSLGVILIFRDTVRAILDGAISSLGGGQKRRARAVKEEFQTSLGYLRERIELLDEYSSEYHNAFHDAGWDDVAQTFNELVAAEAVVEMMMNARRYGEALTLLRLISGDLPSEELEEAKSTYEDFAHLPGWEMRTRENLLSVLEAADKAALLNKDLGVRRARNRQPTLETLAEIRKWLDASS